MKNSLEPYYLFYYAILILGTILSLFCYRKGDKKALFIVLILLAALSIENIRTFLIDRSLRADYLINLYSGIEYSFFVVYYVKSEALNKINLSVRISVVLFSIFSIVNAFLIYRYGSLYYKLITWNVNVEGFLLFIVYTHLLFNIDGDAQLPIYKHPDFWVSVGVLIFYGGVFAIFGLYPILLEIDPATTKIDYDLIIRPLNAILYLCIIGGSICFLTNKNYLIR